MTDNLTIDMLTVALFACALAVVCVWGPKFVKECRALFQPRLPRYVVKAQQHNAKRIAQTPRAHENEAVRRARLELVTRLGERRSRIH